MLSATYRSADRCDFSPETPKKVSPTQLESLTFSKHKQRDICFHALEFAPKTNCLPAQRLAVQPWRFLVAAQEHRACGQSVATIRSVNFKTKRTTCKYLPKSFRPLPQALAALVRESSNWIQCDFCFDVLMVYNDNNNNKTKQQICFSVSQANLRFSSSRSMSYLLFFFSLYWLSWENFSSSVAETVVVFFSFPSSSYSFTCAHNLLYTNLLVLISLSISHSSIQSVRSVCNRNQMTTSILFPDNAVMRPLSVGDSDNETPDWYARYTRIRVVNDAIRKLI